MGYTYTERPSTMRDLVGYVQGRMSGTVKYTSIQGRTAYMAYTPKDSGETFAVALRCAKHGYSWSYKLMDETEFPYYFGAPKRLLAMLTTTTNTNALEWRYRCATKRGSR